jgi:phage baseplate assembly protein W
MAVQSEEIWSDLDHRFVQDSLGNLKKVVNVASVMTSIDNILRTYQGERVMFPQFASKLRGLMFKGMNQTMGKFLAKEIKDSIEIWDARVSVLEVEIILDSDNSTISISIDFVIPQQENIYRYERAFKKG